MMRMMIVKVVIFIAMTTKNNEEDAADHGSKSVAKEGRSEGAKSTTGSESQIRVTGPGETLQKPADRKLVSRVSSTCGWHLGILV